MSRQEYDILGGNIYTDFLKNVNTKGLTKKQRSTLYARWKKDQGYKPLPDIPKKTPFKQKKQLPSKPKQDDIIKLNIFLDNQLDDYLEKNYDNLPKNLRRYYSWLKSTFDLIK